VQGLDLSCLRVAGCGAEPIQAKTLREFADRTKPAGFDPRAFLPSYGMAEATLAISFVPHGTGLSSDVVDAKSLTGGEAKPLQGGAELVDCGVCFPEHEIAIVDENGKRLGDRMVGQIVSRGPSTTSGYYNEPELTAAAWKPIQGSDEAWLHTGDLGYTVGKSLFVCGRLKDIIIIRGRNYYPSDLEWSVSELPGIRRGNVVAFSVPGGSGGDEAEQLIVCAEAFQSDAAGLADAIRQTITAEFALAVADVVMVPQGALPRTSSGKAQRRKTRQMYLDGTLPRARGVQEARGASDDATP